MNTMEPKDPVGYEFYRHIPSGDVFAVQYEGGDEQWAGLYGPIHHSQSASGHLATFPYGQAALDWAAEQTWSPLDPTVTAS